MNSDSDEYKMKLKLEGDIMKKIYIVAILVFIINMNQAFAATSYTSYTKTFKSVNKTAKIVVLDMNDKKIRANIGRALNVVVAAEPLKSIADKKKTATNKVIAALNGTYFSAYNGIPLPYGTIIENGKILHIGNNGAVIGFTNDNKIIIDNLNIQIDGFINDEKQYYAWGINHPRVENDAIVIYTTEYGNSISALGSKAVIVENGQVKNIIENKGNLWAPQNGFIIVFNSDVADLVERFKVGDSVRYDFNYESKNIDQNSQSAVKWNNVKNALGAGPSLIIGGKITAKGEAEGFSEAKINTNRAQRSFIGYTTDNKLYLGTMANANLQEMASICKELNLYGAMCMDGGASSSLYYEGKYITAPGRNINNAMVLTFQ